MCLHHSNLDWEKYISGEVSNRDEYEQALAACPTCFDEYLYLLEGALEEPGPDFADAVMAGLPTEQRGRSITYKPFLHYVVAACLTIILIELGAFDWTQGLTTDSEIWTAIMERLTNVIGTITTNLGGM